MPRLPTSGPFTSWANIYIPRESSFSIWRHRYISSRFPELYFPVLATCTQKWEMGQVEIGGKNQTSMRTGLHSFTDFSFRQLPQVLPPNWTWLISPFCALAYTLQFTHGLAPLWARSSLCGNKENVVFPRRLSSPTIFRPYSVRHETEERSLIPNLQKN